MGAGSHKDKHPKVGLLANGSEDIKGNSVVKTVHKRLQAQERINYIGYVEGHDIFSDKVDVVVCDGFVGNAVLKSCEGATYLLMNDMKEIRKSWLAPIIRPIFRLILRNVFKRYDPKKRSGAVLLGLNGMVVKSHGRSCADEFAAAISYTLEALKHKDTQNVELVSSICTAIVCSYPRSWQLFA